MRALFAIAVTLLAAGSARADGLTYDQLKALIQSRGIASVEDLLPQLPAEYRSDYALVYRTGSVQSASKDQPRIILYGKDAKLTIGIGGDPSKLNSNKLEIIEFDPSAKRFLAREIRFPAPRDPPGTRVEFADHPTTCGSCHRDPIRPNLEPYPTWPGFYGGADDALKTGSDEETAFRRFQQYFAGQGRYRFLAPLRAEPSIAGQVKIVNADSKSPNTELSRNLTSLNFDKVVAEITGAPSFVQLQYAWAGLVAGCFTQPAAVEGFFPDELKARPLGFTATLSDTRSAIATDYAVRNGDLLRDAGLGASNVESASLATTALFRYVGERSGLHPEDWSISPQEAVYTFGTPAYGILDLQQKLSDELARRGISGTCSDLQRKSLDALSGRNPAACVAPQPPAPAAVPPGLIHVTPRPQGR